MKWYVWVAIAFIGRFPAIFLSAVGGSALNNGNYVRLFIIGAIIIVTFLVGTISYYFWHKKHASGKKDGSSKPEEKQESGAKTES